MFVRKNFWKKNIWDRHITDLGVYQFFVDLTTHFQLNVTQRQSQCYESMINWKGSRRYE